MATFLKNIPSLFIALTIGLMLLITSGCSSKEGTLSVVGCMDFFACNYNEFATRTNDICVYGDEVCRKCSGETDGTGTVVSNDKCDEVVANYCIENDVSKGIGCIGSNSIDYYSNDGISSPLRIVNGCSALQKEYPYQVRVILNGSGLCGGSIVDDEWILTAAHCLEGLTASNVVVKSIGSTSVFGGDQINASALYVHENYDSGTLNNDVGLIKLESSLQTLLGWGTAIVPITLNGQANTLVDECAIVTGWGTTSFGGTSPYNLQEVGVPIISDSACSSVYGVSFNADTMICGGYQNGYFDSCQGDSGGAFVIRNGDGAFVQVGVVSWGDGCAEGGKPGVYAEVSYFIDWINTKINTH